MAGLSSPSRASRPRPKPLGFLVAIVCIPFQIRLAAWARLLTQGFLFHTAYELVAELDVCLGAARAFVVDDAGQAMAWCFGQPHVARNNSLEHLVAEVRFDLCGNLLLQGYPRIKHDTQQTDQL